jgi:hypothetical protein
MEPVCTFAPQTTTTKHLVNFCVSHQRLHHWNNWRYRDWSFVQLHFCPSFTRRPHAPST